MILNFPASHEPPKGNSKTQPVTAALLHPSVPGSRSIFVPRRNCVLIFDAKGGMASMSLYGLHTGKRIDSRAAPPSHGLPTASQLKRYTLTALKQAAKQRGIEVDPLCVKAELIAALTKSDANAGRSAASSMELAARLHHSPREIPTVGASQGAPSSMAMAGVSGVSGPMSAGGVHNPTSAHMVSAPMQPSVSAAYTSGAVSVPALSTTTTTAVRPATSHQDVAHEPQGAASQAASGSCVDCGCAVPGSPTNGVARCGACFHARRSPPQKRPRDDSSATGESLADVASSGASLRTQPGSHDVNPRAAKRQRECAGCGAESKDDAWSLGPNEIMCETCRTQLGADQAQIVHAPGGDGSPTPIDTSSDEPPHVSNRVVVGV